MQMTLFYFWMVQRNPSGRANKFKKVYSMLVLAINLEKTQPVRLGNGALNDKISTELNLK